MRVASRILGIVEPPVDRVNQERLRLEAGGGEPILNLGQAIPDFGPPAAALAAAARALNDPATHVYTPDPGLPELREAIAGRLRERSGNRAIRAEEIVVTAGANHAFLLVCSILLDPGDRVGLLTPYFLNHKMAVEGCGGSAIEIQPNDDFTYSPEAVERAIVEHRLRALVVVNPSNPTGKVFQREELQRLLDLCRAHRVWLIADEVYSSFVYAPAEMVPVDGLPGAGDSTFSIGSFSKDFGMTGWRLGWVRAPAEVVSDLLKVQDYSIICAPRPAQVVALAALADAPDWARSHLDELTERRLAALSELRGSGLFQIFDGLGAYFLWFRPHAAVDSERETRELMRRARVCVLPGAFFGEAARTWFRLSYGSQKLDILHTACRRLVEHFAIRDVVGDCVPQRRWTC